MSVNVFRLAYVDFFSKDPAHMVEYYSEIMGYRITEEQNGITYLSNGYDHHNIVITPSDKQAIRSYGYQLDGGLSLDEVQEKLIATGIESRIQEDVKPGVSRFIELNDPSGNTIELFTEINQPAVGFSGLGINPLKLGHVAFLANNYEETITFYHDVLGFTFTDKIGENFANFLTCNTDHHVINIIAANDTRLHHIAFQVKDASHQYAASDLLAKHEIPIIWGPSRHTAGSNIATYHRDPEDNVVELYTDMDVFVPELGIFEPRPWHTEMPYKPKVWEGLSVWGTEFQLDLAKI
ncbi:VOC family protein [Oceanobacillus damuensis]|uniref:VOC family protein n=1 Tax=Oceanobacillus damuensis TaxID=937928 RepID=UPI00082D0EFB|nr:VOC family protein [Oceanobacillus damuensis]